MPRRTTPIDSQQADNIVFDTPLLNANLGASATRNVKPGPGHVMSLTVFNDNATRRFAQLHNVSAAPSDDDVPVDVFLVPGDSQVVIGTDYFGQYGVEFDTGISFVFSTAVNTAVSATAADCTAFIKYR